MRTRLVPLFSVEADDASLHLEEFVLDQKEIARTIKLMPPAIRHHSEGISPPSAKHQRWKRRNKSHKVNVYIYIYYLNVLLCILGDHTRQT